MKTNWPIKKLGEVCDFKSIKNTKLLPYVGMEDIESNSGHFIGSLTPRKVKSTTTYFDASCVLYGKLRPYLNKVFLPDFEGQCSTEFVTLRPDLPQLSREWLTQWLRSEQIVAAMTKSGSGARMPRANLQLLRNFDIPSPPLETQRKVVKKIEELFAKIAQAQSLRESAIQDTNNLIPATLSKILEEGKKKGWDINTLANICLTFTDGDWIESKDQSSDGIRLVQTGNIGNGGFLNKADRSRFISVATFERLGCTEIFPNDLLISRLPNPVGRSCLIPETGQRMITAVDCTIVRIDTKGANQKYVMYFTNSSDYFEQVSRLISGTTRDRISRKNLGTIKIPLPPLAEQREIVERMDAVTQKVRELQKLQSETAANLTALKQSILHQAFEGRLIN